MRYAWQIVRLAACLATTVIALPALAEVSADDAKPLSGPALTEWGAEKSGNQDGTIPPYTGAGIKAPSDWDPKNPGRRPDPYGEKPLISITAQNAAQYADKLDGTMELFKRYPNFRMDIYPSHRDYVFPKYVLENTVKNAASCKAVDKELRLEGCYGGLPFPIPKTGNQVMWNHLLNFQSWNSGGIAESWVVPTSGDPVMMVRGEFLYNWPYFDPAKTEPHAASALYFRYLGKEEAPSRLAGGQMLIHDPIDQLNIGRSAWIYMPGRRWTKLAAELAYDTPNPYSGGSGNMDDSFVFFGALDRYDFKLVGKKEKFIYYNNYQLSDEKACSAAKVLSTRGFPNPDCIRWELHRVWVVEATLKPGFNHIYHKRIFYWDEDGFGAGQAENYNADGKIHRIINAIFIPYFEAPGGSAGSIVYMDLKSGIWSTSGISSCPGCGWSPITTRIPENVFSPNAMSASGIR